MPFCPAKMVAMLYWSQATPILRCNLMNISYAHNAVAILVERTQEHHFQTVHLRRRKSSTVHWVISTWIHMG